jgi:hypothetical protein
MLPVLLASLALLMPMAPVSDGVGASRMPAATPILCQSLYTDVSVEKVTTMFQQMRDDAHWDTAAPLRWGFYFEDHSREKLQKLGDALTAKGYRLVEIRPAGALLQLHLEKTEIYTPQSLVDQNGELIAAAIQACIMRYDGFDVGPAK